MGFSRIPQKLSLGALGASRNDAGRPRPSAGNGAMVEVTFRSPLVNCYITIENHHFSWEISLFQWSFSIAFCMFTRGYTIWLFNSSPWKTLCLNGGL